MAETVSTAPEVCSPTGPARDAESKPALLLVDDEPSILTSLRRALRRQHHRIITCESPLDALAVLDRENVGVVVSDYKMPQMDGVAFLSHVKDKWPLVQRIMLTGNADEAAIEGVINRSAVFRFLAKPWDQQTLVLTISDSFEQYRLLCENEELWDLTQEQNEQLKGLTRALEGKIERRTRQLERAKVEWERTFDAIVDPVAIVNERHEVVRANLAYADHSDVAIREVPGRKCYDLVAGRNSPCEGCPLTSGLRGETSRGVDVHAMHGRVLNVSVFPIRAPMPTDPVTVSVPPILPPFGFETEPPSAIDLIPMRAAVCHYRDVTEERTLQNKLARTEKLASLGLFVGGVAHEINNPLGGILAFTQLLLRGAPSDDELMEMLAAMEKSALRCKRIIDSLQSFAHGSTQLNRESVDFEVLVADAIASFERDYSSRDRATITYSVDPETPKVRGDAALFHQLFRNLLHNALHALKPSGGTVTIGVRSDGCDDVIVEVTDNGSGIADAAIPRLFDPFYSTKGTAGTGLGLSICHRIVEKHGGHIEVESTVGEGTTFRMLFPVESSTTDFKVMEIDS